LKYLDVAVATHLKHVFETLAKTPEKCLKIIANICKI
jgi:hypothetical protein